MAARPRKTSRSKLPKPAARRGGPRSRRTPSRPQGRPARQAKRKPVMAGALPGADGRKRRAVVLASGGLDSSVCLAIARRAGYEVYALSFDYGQRHGRELEYAREQARLAGAVRHAVVRIGLDEIGGSALTAGFAVPKGDGDIEPGIPVTYVPARNTVFLSIALGWAEVLHADAIFIGVNAVDYSGYPDCRPAFIKAFERTARLATKLGVEGKWKPVIETPLLRLTKGEIVKLGAKLGVDFSRTWSCYDPEPDGRPCGHCDSCRLRARGFADAGLPDPGR